MTLEPSSSAGSEASTRSGSERLKRRPPPPVLITVLTGFLGAGKTTLLNQWVRTAAFADAAVVINEFGEIGIDHLLVEQTDGSMMTLSSGCLCCSVRGDLMDMLEDLIRRRDNGRVSPFQRLVIETTGLADPAPVLNAIMAHPYLPLRYRIDSVVTVVDALHGSATLEHHGEARSQVAVADTLVITKTDLSPPAGRSSLETQLRALNPAARILDAGAGQASAEAILDGGLVALERPAVEPRHALVPERFNNCDDDHNHHHAPGHAHSHDRGIDSLCLTAEVPLDPATFEMFLDLVRGTYGANLLRIKGIVALADAPDRPRVVHGVQHFMHPAHQLQGWPDTDRRTRVVFIMQDLDPALLAGTWAAFFGQPAVDRPDAAALLQGRTDRGGLFG